MAAHYTRRAMEAPDSSYRSLQQYRAELSHVHDTLQRMEDQYLGTDQVAADRYRRTENVVWAQFLPTGDRRA